jgi:putative ABC transport system permease protein
MNLRSRAALRFYLRHPAQLALAIAGIALGVAVVLAIDLASDTALRAFKLSQSLTSPRASHNVQASRGDLPEDLYRLVKVTLGVDLAAPVIDGRLRLAGEQSVSLLGIDPLAELAFDNGLRLAGSGDGPAFDVAELMTRPNAVVLPEAMAARLSLAPGDDLVATLAGEQQQLRVVGVVRLQTGAGQYGPVIADIGTAQALLGKTGAIGRIELALSDDEVERVAAGLPAGTSLIPVEAAGDVTREMLRAFRINLAALSLLALVVGMLLIYATMSFAIVQRRESFGTLRALGLTRGEVAGDVLAESLLLGVIATGLGLGLGWLLAQNLTGLVLTTINDLYFTARVTPDGVSWPPFAKAGLLGIAATLVAGARPAVEAARESPRAAMTRAAYERTARRQARFGPPAAAAAFAVAALLISLPGDSLLPAFIGLFLVLAGYGVMTPAALAWLLRWLGRGARPWLGLSPRLALRGAVASLGRTGVAVTALAIAVAHVVGIGIMIDSFRASVIQWLDSSLVADYYLLAGGGEGAGFSESELARLNALPGVRGLSLSRTMTVKTAAGEVAIRAAAAGPDGYGEVLVSGDDSQAFAALDQGDQILLAEAFARRRVLSVGDRLSLPTQQGERDFQVAGIYRDYRTSDSGALLPYGVVAELWGDQAPTGVGVYTRGEDAGAALAAFVTERGNVTLGANSDIRRVTLMVFDRTFTVTGILRLLGGLVAFFGILSALLALQLERVREVATLRALGFTRAQAGANALAQTTLLGLVAGLLALPLGVALAGLLIYVINERSFGWSMGFTVAPGQLATGIALAVGAAFLAGLYPGRRLAFQPIARGLRAE